MTKAVLELGALREAADAYQLNGPQSALAIPTSLHDSLMARLDRLHPVKEVAQAAAVIGRSFDHATIAALSGLPEPALGDAMRRLVEAELVFRRGTPPTRPTCSSTPWCVTPPTRACSRPSAPRCTPAWSTSWRGPPTPPGGPDAARRGRGAGRARARLLGAGGRKGLERPAYQEAVASLENGIRLCRALGEDVQWRYREQELQLQLGQALIANQGYQAAATMRAFEGALMLADEFGDVSLQLPALFGLWAGQHIAGTGSGELVRRSSTGPRPRSRKISGGSGRSTTRTRPATSCASAR